jgi:hypothetical protein
LQPPPALPAPRPAEVAACRYIHHVTTLHPGPFRSLPSTAPTASPFFSADSPMRCGSSAAPRPELTVHQREGQLEQRQSKGEANRYAVVRLPCKYRDSPLLPSSPLHSVISHRPAFWLESRTARRGLALAHAGRCTMIVSRESSKTMALRGHATRTAPYRPMAARRGASQSAWTRCMCTCLRTCAATMPTVGALTPAPPFRLKSAAGAHTPRAAASRLEEHLDTGESQTHNTCADNVARQWSDQQRTRSGVLPHGRTSGDALTSNTMRRRMN